MAGTSYYLLITSNNLVKLDELIIDSSVFSEIILQKLLNQ
jgi:hypothetical protein